MDHTGRSQTTIADESRSGWRGFHHRMQARLEKHPGLRIAYRIGVGVLGGLVLAAGILMIPYPGPGWLVVFAGLAILATEFAWAHRVLHWAKGYYDAWTRWLNRQHLAVRITVLLGTGLIVLATLWLLNVGGMVTSWFGLHWPWLRSPFSSSAG